MAEALRITDAPSERRAAKAAGLRYVRDDQPGLTRRRAGRGFAYSTHDGRRVRDRETLRRIAALAVPPAWADVWICPRADGHIQATGRDARGRKQYRYHARWSAQRNSTKYDRLIEFAEALPRIRRAVAQHLRRPGLARRQVLAAVVQLLEQTAIRVGNDEYARTNSSFGLTTLRRKHVVLARRAARLEFRGKHAKAHMVEIRDPRLVQIIRNCHELPGHELFKFYDEDGTLCDVDSADVNAYIREIAGADFTAKDFRTWAGTYYAALELERGGPAASAKDARRKVRDALCAVAGHLHNRPATCRKYYVHPAVLDAYEEGTLLASLGQPRGKGGGRFGLDARSRAILKVLRAHRRAGRKRKGRLATALARSLERV